MSTVLDIVSRALRELNLVGAGDDPDSGLAAKTLDTLNGMGQGWEADGIHAGWPVCTLSDDFPLEPKHEEGVVYLLARRVAGGRGQQLTIPQAAMAETGYSRLVADYKTVENLRFDGGLVGRRGAWR